MGPSKSVVAKGRKGEIWEWPLTGEGFPPGEMNTFWNQVRCSTLTVC